METSRTENNALVNVEMQPEYFDTPMNDVETQLPKRRKKKSIVWEHFTIENVGAGVRRAVCKECAQSFAYSTGSKVAGTSHLKRHIAKGGCPVFLRNQDQNHSTPLSAPTKMAVNSGGPVSNTRKRRYRTPSVSHLTFDPDRCRQEMARMIIQHDYPLHMVEHAGFMAFVHNLQPNFNMANFDTVQGDCVATYLREKQTVQKLIDEMPGRISLTLDLWSSYHTTGYVFVTGQFIDSEWKMHKKLLNVVMEPYPESDSAFSHAVSTCLSDWNMEGRLFSVTINQPLSEIGINSLRGLLSVKNSNILDGQLLLPNCFARSLSCVAQELLHVGQETVKKVRDCVKYVKTSESLEEKFVALKQQKQLQVISTKTLSIDDQTQWNTTYEMLLAASELKKVFSCLDTLDPDYPKGPTDEEWKLVDNLCTHLKPLFKTASLLTSSTVPTANTFFHEASDLKSNLSRESTSDGHTISMLTKPIHDSFDKYWKSCCLMLAIAVVMDPRFKMKLVEFNFKKIYGDEAAVSFINIVDEGIHELFLEYVAFPPAFVDVVNGESQDDVRGVNNGVGLTDFDVYIMESKSQESKSELDQYLEESVLPRIHEFDVMKWWKLHKVKYPTLSKMAQDILTVAVSTVFPGAVFDTRVKEMDGYRCCLRPETVEALFCSKDWMNSEPVETTDSLVKMEFPI